MPSRSPKLNSVPATEVVPEAEDRQAPSFGHFIGLHIVSREILCQRGFQPRPSSHPRPEMQLVFLLYHPQHTAPRGAAYCTQYFVPINSCLPEPLIVAVGSLRFSPKPSYSKCLIHLFQLSARQVTGALSDKRVCEEDSGIWSPRGP